MWCFRWTGEMTFPSAISELYEAAMKYHFIHVLKHICGQPWAENPANRLTIVKFAPAYISQVVYESRKFEF